MSTFVSILSVAKQRSSVEKGAVPLQEDIQPGPMSFVRVVTAPSRRGTM